jgi:hypothetical protein
MSHKRLSTRSGQILLLAIGFYLVLTAAYTIYTVHHEKGELITELDRDLMNAARGIPLMLPSDFFDRAVQPDAVSEQEDRQNIESLTRLANSLEMAYLYTLVDIDGTVYITSSSASEEEQQEHTEVRTFTAYPEMEAAVRNAIERGEPVFSSYTDRWGTFRHGYIPLQNEQGIPYVLAAD